MTLLQYELRRLPPGVLNLLDGEILNAAEWILFQISQTFILTSDNVTIQPKYHSTLMFPGRAVDATFIDRWLRWMRQEYVRDKKPMAPKRFFFIEHNLTVNMSTVASAIRVSCYIRLVRKFFSVLFYTFAFIFSKIRCTLRRWLSATERSCASERPSMLCRNTVRNISIIHLYIREVFGVCMWNDEGFFCVITPLIFNGSAVSAGYWCWIIDWWRHSV